MGTIPGFWAGAAKYGRGVAWGRLVDELGRERFLADPVAALAARGAGGPRWEAWVRHPPVRSVGDVLTPEDPRYPANLLKQTHPPPFLCVHGDASALQHVRTAIVGTRRCTPWGRTVAHNLGAALASSGDVVVSGLARGIDAAAHEGALATGRTVAVVAHGLHFLAPQSHRRLRDRIVKQGAVVSPFFDDLEPRPHTFPLRNPVVSGLAHATIVVEAPERSGALITAREAADQHRTVFALRGPPGFPDAPSCAGNRRLIAEGALAIDSIATFVQQRANWPVATGLLRYLIEGDALDSIAREADVPIERLLAEVGRLEREGLVVRRPGQRYALFQPPRTP